MCSSSASHVTVEDELSLKQYVCGHGLIVMGPDCGTSIVSGIGFGFSNVIRRGPVGAIGAAGTGLQEFTTLVHRWGSGISHGIGTGGRDVSDAIGGISLLSAVDALERDEATQVIAVVSKPPGAKTLACLVERIAPCRKPVAACFLGIGDELPMRTCATVPPARWMKRRASPCKSRAAIRPSRAKHHHCSNPISDC